ncbi:MAG: hypothetical protein K0S20_15 [Patescibacteria group bacterium]|jgi:choline kinase|nr:hypothetical protein [Patescibacteria group bacterium]
MKAVILAAGIGSRLRPHTDTKPKSLIEVSGVPMMERMIKAIREAGITEIIIVTGYREEYLKDFISSTFPDLSVMYVRNNEYLTTNTGYSLHLAKESIGESDFVKFDADVVFEPAILKALLESPRSAFTVDTNINLDAEEVKVRVDAENVVINIGKDIDPSIAAGESIGMEKITADTATRLFPILKEMAEDPASHQLYYESAYDRLLEMGEQFGIVDITGKTWVEIDTHEDLALANTLF